MAVQLKKDLWWVGALDANLRVFDIVMMTPFGTTYNSYLLKGSKATVLFETVKDIFYPECEKHIDSILKAGEKIDYFVLNHTEPDHSGSLRMLLKRFPDAKVVATEPAHMNLQHIAQCPYNKVVVEEGTTPIDIGGYTLKFIIAPFLHWPDTMFTYVEEAEIVVTCDFLGSHYCYSGVVDDTMSEKDKEDYISAAKGYYDPIFGPFQTYALKGLEHLRALRFDTVCCSHGPVLRKNIALTTELYTKWSQPAETKERVVIAFVSAYRYTRDLAMRVHAAVERAGVPAALYDLVERTPADIAADVASSRGLVLGTPTILGDALPPIWAVANSLNPIIHRDKVVGVFGSYGWSGEGTRNISARLDQMRLRQPLEPLAVCFRPGDDALARADEWGAAFARALRGETLPDERPLGGPAPASSTRLRTRQLRSVPTNDGRLRRWRCVVCGEIIVSVLPPTICLACGAGEEAFVCLGLCEDPQQNAATSKCSSSRSSFSGDVVIIGGGCAAVAAARAARESSDAARIILVCDENEPPYYRPSLTKALADKTVRQDPKFRLLPDSWWRDYHVELLLSACASSIDKAGRTVHVTLADGSKRSVRYDSLVLATGGKNFIPVPQEQTQAKGVYNLRTLLDVDAITRAVEEISARGKKDTTAVIVGGGLAALEAAEALLALKVRAHIVELMPRLLPRQLTEDGSRIYTAALSATGVVPHLGTSVKEIQHNADGIVCGVVLGNGHTITADLVAFGVGTTPETSLARSIGLTVRKGICVDKCMRTSAPDIYACGDCTEFNGRNIPNWTEALAQGRTAGLQAVGATSAEGSVFRRVASPYFLDAFCPIFSVGAVPVDGTTIPLRRAAFAAGSDFAELYFASADHTTESEGETAATTAAATSPRPLLVGAQIVGKHAKMLQVPIVLAIEAGNFSYQQAIELVADEFQ